MCIRDSENAVFPLEGKTGYELQVTEDCLTASTGRMTLRFGKRPWELSVFLDGKLLTRENVCDANAVSYTHLDVYKRQP